MYSVFRSIDLIVYSDRSENHVNGGLVISHNHVLPYSNVYQFFKPAVAVFILWRVTKKQDDINLFFFEQVLDLLVAARSSVPEIENRNIQRSFKNGSSSYG